MRVLQVMLLAALSLAATAWSPSSPPVGQWQGAYESRDVMIVARLEIDSTGTILLAAPDAADIAGASAEDREAIRRRLSDGLIQAWEETLPRHMEFDGRIFRKPAGVAPQLEWNPDTKRMTAVLYLGMQAAVRILLHPVTDFSSNPWT